MIIILKNERPPSWNQIYAGIHHTERKEIVDRIHDLVIAELIDMGIQVMNKKHILKEKVNIDIRAYFKDRPIDSDNIPAKIYIDALKFILIWDDTMQYVGKVSTQSFLDKENPRMEIELYSL